MSNKLKKLSNKLTRTEAELILRPLKEAPALILCETANTKKLTLSEAQTFYMVKSTLKS